MLVWRHQPAAGFSLLTPPSPITPPSPLTPSLLTPSAHQFSSTEGFIKHRVRFTLFQHALLGNQYISNSAKICTWIKAINMITYSMKYKLGMKKCGFFTGADTQRCPCHDGAARRATIRQALPCISKVRYHWSCGWIFNRFTEAALIRPSQGTEEAMCAWSCVFVCHSFRLHWLYCTVITNQAEVKCS